MSDPFWDDLDAALPRDRRPEPHWARRRAKVRAALSATRWPRRAASVLAAGMAAAALALLLRRPAPPPVPAAPTALAEDLEFLEAAPLLENLDEIMDSPELDNA